MSSFKYSTFGKLRVNCCLITKRKKIERIPYYLHVTSNFPIFVTNHRLQTYLLLILSNAASFLTLERSGTMPALLLMHQSACPSPAPFCRHSIPRYLNFTWGSNSLQFSSREPWPHTWRCWSPVASYCEKENKSRSSSAFDLIFYPVLRHICLGSYLFVYTF